MCRGARIPNDFSLFILAEFCILTAKQKTPAREGTGAEIRLYAIRASATLSTEVPEVIGMAGFLASGSSYGCAFPVSQWLIPILELVYAAFITCYSCGTARDSHPFPF